MINNNKIVNKSGSNNIKSTKQNIRFDPTPIRDTNNKSDIDDNDIGINTPIQNIENDDEIGRAHV